MHELNRRGFLGSGAWQSSFHAWHGAPVGWSRAEGASQVQGAHARLARYALSYLASCDPTTTMTVPVDCPLAEEAGAPSISYSRHRQNDWARARDLARFVPFPTTNRSGVSGRDNGLECRHRRDELRIGMEQTACRFRTMPARATNAFHFISGGDCGVNQLYAVNNNIVAARQDPMFPKASYRR